MKARKPLRYIAISSFILLMLAIYVYRELRGPMMYADDGSAMIIEVPRNTPFDSLQAQLLSDAVIRDTADFRQLAEHLGYRHDPVRSGRYVVPSGISMRELIRVLHRGKQTPVNLIFTTERELSDVAAKADRFLALKAEKLTALFSDSLFLDSIGYDQYNLMSLFIPDTYEVYWDVLPRDLIKRMLKEHETFWARNNRWKKAEQLGLDSKEVYTLASIIERETRQNDEKQRMAGVYYNRLQQDMRLQADPTAVFASRDFYTTRVTRRHLRVDSPYNTYRYKGLPPGPITMTSIASIDAVLELEQHDYIFFCARGDGSGYHNFAVTLAEHKRNAESYRKNRRKRRKG
ncbi:MAG: endolytic transglycosylase MltG [Bacteroidota bacterium]